jgi:hypothetical protein
VGWSSSIESEVGAMKVTCEKTKTGVEYNYGAGKPEGNFDVVIYYRANSDKEVAEVADMLEHVAKFIRQWKYSEKYTNPHRKEG